MSGVKCQVSGVRCQVLGVRFQVSSFTCKKNYVIYIYIFFCDDLLELYGGGSVINGAYLVIFFY